MNCKKSIAATVHPMSFQENRPLSIFFSELYNVPVKIKKDYFKIKVLELLLYLDALELRAIQKNAPIFIKARLRKSKRSRHF